MFLKLLCRSSDNGTDGVLPLVKKNSDHSWRILQSMSVSIFPFNTGLGCNVPFKAESWFTEYGVIPTCYVSVWTVLYFIQMIPAIGHFVNSIQKMLTIMVKFLIVYIFILIPYPHAFLLLLSNDEECKPNGFDNIGHAIYSIFKIMLNMIDFDDYSSSRFSVHLLHIIYVFTVAVLLVNFLIALLSTSVGETVEAGDVIMMLQRLSVITTLKRRLCFFCPLYYKIMNRLVCKCENGRIYLRCKRFSGVKFSR